MLQKTFKSQLTLSRSKSFKGSHKKDSTTSNLNGKIKQATLKRKAWNLLSKPSNLFSSSNELTDKNSRQEFESEIDTKKSISRKSESKKSFPKKRDDRSISKANGNKSFMSTLKRQATLRRKPRKVKQTNEYSEISLSKIIVTRKDSDTSIVDDESEEMLVIRESFRESSKGQERNIRSFRDAKKFFSQFQLNLSNSSLESNEKRSSHSDRKSEEKHRSLSINEIDVSL